MKYLVTLFVLLAGCTECPEPKKFVPYGSGTETCREMVNLGWIKNQADFDRCTVHTKGPKLKSGQFVKIKESNYAANCKFRVGAADWSGFRMKPMYHGSVLCKDINGKYETVDNWTYQLEENLK